MELLSADSAKSSQDSDSTPFGGYESQSPGVDGVGFSGSANMDTWAEQRCGKTRWADVDVESPTRQAEKEDHKNCHSVSDTRQGTQQLQSQQDFQTQGYHPSMVQGHSCMPCSAPVPPGSVHKQPQSKKTQAKKMSKQEMKDPERSGHRGHKAETFERLVSAFSCGKTAHLKSEVIVQIFGKKPQDVDLEGVEKPTIITAEFRCFTGTNAEDAGDLKLIDLKEALAMEGLTLLQEAFKRSNIELRGTPVDFSDYCDIVRKRLAARANTRSNVPKPEIREKLLAGNTDGLCFLIRDAKELSDLNMVKESGFQSEVKKFLEDPDLTWTCLAGVRKPDYQKNESYGISGSGCKILGVVAIKSSDGTVTPLRISARIWLRRKDLNVIRRIIVQIVLQVFGANPMHRNHDVRRNHHTMEDVFEEFPIEAVVRCFCDESHKEEKDENERGLVIKLNQALPDSLQKAFESLHFTLEGQEKDFSKYADLVAKRLRARPEVDKRFKWKTIKDFKGEWLPGNLFTLTLSEHLSFDLENTGGYMKELDGHIVVLLPSRECDGGVVEEDEQLLVARMDMRRRAIYLVPRKALHPLGIAKDQETGSEKLLQTDNKLKELTTYLRSQYQYKVLVRQEDRWRTARLCLNMVGAECMVQFVDADEKLSEPQPVNADDLKLAKALSNIEAKLGAGREAASLASLGQTGQTNLTQRTFKSVVLSEVLKDSEIAEIMKHFTSGFADSASFLQGKAEDLSNLDMVKKSGFQSEVQEFLKDDDPDFSWTFRGVSEPDQSNESNGTSENDSKILGVVAIKSADSSRTPLRISAGIWLQKEDRGVFRGIMAQIVSRVFGKASPHKKHDVRRNRFTLRGVRKTTQTEAHLCCFIKNEESQQIERLQPEMDLIDLKNMCGKDDSSWVKKAFLSLNLMLTGEEQDFLDYADVVAQMKVHFDKQNEGATKPAVKPAWKTCGGGNWANSADSSGESGAEEIP